MPAVQNPIPVWKKDISLVKEMIVSTGLKLKHNSALKILIDVWSNFGFSLQCLLYVYRSASFIFWGKAMRNHHVMQIFRNPKNNLNECLFGHKNIKLVSVLFSVDLTYTLHIRRRTFFYVFNIIVPCVMLSVLTLLTFWLPTTSGTKTLQPS